MISLLSWLALVLGMAGFAWFFAVRARGSLKFWIRTYEAPGMWVLGREFATEAKEEHSQFLIDGNAVVRSLDRQTNRVYRQWDRKRDRLFLGLVLNAKPDEAVPDDHVLREVKSQPMVRISGTNRLDESKELPSAKAFAEREGLELDWEHPVRLSGQSFSLYQWAVLDRSESGGGNGLIGELAEWTNQLRNNLVLPLLATWLAVALMGTAQPLLLVLGILLICFLSGACKFVFVHQMTDEADEIHLQNY